MNTHTRKRGGYTLIELLVVLSLMAVLAALVIAFLPNAASSQVEARAAVQVQGWLNVAKQRAMRDQAPRGLRLILLNPDPTFNLNLVVTDCQYLEQPDDFNSGAILNQLPPNMLPIYTYQNTLFLPTADPTNGYGFSVPPSPGNVGDVNVALWNVQPGDNLEVLGTGLMHKIIQVGAADKTGTLISDKYIVVQPPLTYPVVNPTLNYRIVRAPRAVGDQTLSMPGGTVIDVGTNYTTFAPMTSPLPAGSANSVDIMFSPSGAVISPGLTGGNLNLWVRAPDTSADKSGNVNVGDPYRGDPTIISVFVNTGFVGAYQTARVPTYKTPWSLVY